MTRFSCVSPNHNKEVGDIAGITMADSVNVANFPESGSPARVAFELMTYLQRSGVKTPEGQDKRKFVLDLYAECIDAAKGRRSV